MRWQDQSERITFPAATAFLEKLNAADNIRLTGLSNALPRFAIASHCFDKIMAHVGTSRDELGGLLLGQAFGGTNGAAPQIVVATRCVESKTYDSTNVSLRMETEVWDVVRPLLSPTVLVVGWYHSHPDLGAFFSDTDRATQRSFFRQEFNVGIVIDPMRKELKAYIGPECAEIPAENVIVYESKAT